jgi:hypothetical protein
MSTFLLNPYTYAVTAPSGITRIFYESPYTASRSTTTSVTSININTIGSVDTGSRGLVVFFQGTTDLSTDTFDVRLNLVSALKLLDSATISSDEIETAYQNVRIQKTGSFAGDVATIVLTDENPLFDASSLTFITLDILVKDANDAVDPNWRNDLIYFSIKTNQNNKVEVKIDSGGVATHYRLIAINEKPNKFNIR